MTNVFNPNDPTLIEDSDSDTKVQVEESADEDIIRFDCAGTEIIKVEELGTTVNSAPLGTGATVVDALKVVYAGSEIQGIPPPFVGTPPVSITGLQTGINIDFDFTAFAPLYSANTVKGLNIDMDVSFNEDFYGGANRPITCQFMTGTIDLTETAGTITPADTVMNFSANYIGQAYTASQGAYKLSVGSDGTAGQLACLRTSATTAGSGETTGYQGFAAASGTATGTLIGVDAITQPLATTGKSIALRADPGKSGGNDSTMGVYSKGHVLIEGVSAAGGGSLLVGGLTTPNGTSTTHCDFVNNVGEAYIKNLLEVDGIIYGDNATTSLEALGDISIKADNKDLKFGAGGDADIYYDGTDLWINTDTVGTGSLKIGDASNYTEIERDGDINFVGGGGLAYGDVFAYDTSTTITIGDTGIANKVQITAFATNGVSNNTTPSHTNDHITVTKAGHYLCTVSVSAASVAGAAALYGFGVWVNNGATQKTNVHSHRRLAGGGSDEGSISMSGIIDLAASDTVEVWLYNETNTQDIVIDDITLSLVQVGGT